MASNRRTKLEMQQLRAEIYSICDQYQPVTVRQDFYQMVARGHVDKTESAYRSTVARLMSQMRRDGSLPFSWVADNTRWMRMVRTYNGMLDILLAVRQVVAADFLEAEEIGRGEG